MLQKLAAILLLIGMGTAGTALGQSRSCGTMEQVTRLEQTKPGLRNQIKQQARLARQSNAKDGSLNEPLSSIITIPVVVHVLYNVAEQNISDAQIQSQIAALNQDFRRQNADVSKTPSLFQSVAADTEIEFCLAQRTPDGEPTTGITRTQTNVSDFILDDKMKFSASGGKNAWDTEKYLNIWVVRISNQEDALGYGQFPNSGSPLTDGVVIDYRFFGTTGTATSPFNKGRTTTHEVGHWLNLFHIWGDESCGDDEVADTPTQEEENVGCPGTFPLPSCNNTSDMYMNYMDYTDDACMNLFTAGQKAVMRTALTSLRPGILTSQGCMSVPVPELDAALLEITSPSSIVCENSFAPAVVLRNRGAQTLTNVQIRYQLNKGSAQTFTWTGSLPSFQSTTVTLPAQTATAGQQLLSLAIVSRNNVTTDANKTNDLVSTSFQAQGVSLPLSESFEETASPPAGWALGNPDGGVTWARTTLAAHTGSAAVYMNNHAYDMAGQVDELVLPPLDLTSKTSPLLSFQVAYSLYSSADYSDTLEVWISKDCGETYQRLFQKFGQALTTAVPAFTEDEYVPKASEWRLETIDLSAFAAVKTAIIKFRHITDFENNLYLDDIQVNGGPLGTREEEQAQEAVRISPNPTSGLIQIESPEAMVISVQVMNTVGNVLLEEQFQRSGANQILQLSLQNQPSGVYLIRLTTDKGVVVRRVVLVR